MMPEINTELAKSFKKIVTAGWAQHSNGDVESPTGHFAYIPISTNELNELVDACLEDGDAVPVEEQYYVLVEDSDGNPHLYIYGSTREALDHFNQLTEQYERWLITDEDEKMHLVCDCGEAFDTIETAAVHRYGDDDCGLSFRILPESEAM